MRKLVSVASPRRRQRKRTNLFVAEKVSRLAKAVTEAAIADGVAVLSGVLVGSDTKIGAVQALVDEGLAAFQETGHVLQPVFGLSPVFERNTERLWEFMEQVRETPCLLAKHVEHFPLALGIQFQRIGDIRSKGEAVVPLCFLDGQEDAVNGIAKAWTGGGNRDW